MTVRDALARLRSMAKEHTSDSALPNRLLWSMLETGIGLLVYREGMKFFNQDVFRHKEVVPTVVDINCTNCLPWEKQGYMVDIGSLWSTKDGPVIRYVGSMDGATEYRVVSQTEFVQKTRLRGNKQKYTYYRDGKLFIEKPVECVRVEYYEPFNMGACTYLDQELKVPNNIQDELFRLAFQNLSVYLSKPMDMTDNKNSNQ